MGCGCLQVVEDRLGFASQAIDVGLGSLNAAIGSVDFEKMVPIGRSKSLLVFDSVWLLPLFIRLLCEWPDCYPYCKGAIYWPRPGLQSAKPSASLSR